MLKSLPWRKTINQTGYEKWRLTNAAQGSGQAEVLLTGKLGNVLVSWSKAHCKSGSTTHGLAVMVRMCACVQRNDQALEQGLDFFKKNQQLLTPNNLLLKFSLLSLKQYSRGKFIKGLKYFKLFQWEFFAVVLCDSHFEASDHRCWKC